jgi:ribosomal protein S18 acetylase RimI-like enzyme
VPADPKTSTQSLHFRPLLKDDQSRLWHWLHIALWDPPPAGLRPLEVLQNPGVRIYAEDWGRPGDVGVVAQVDGADAGACWMRLLPPGVGLGYVDEATPQLGIALQPEHQHRGHGGPMMRAALQAARDAGYRQVSLTVHPQNPAIKVYERCGFRQRGLRGSYHLMVAVLG